MPLFSFFSISTIIISLLIVLLVVGVFAFYRLFQRRNTATPQAKGKQSRQNRSSHQQQQQDMSPNTQLYVGNLPFKSDEDDLGDLFSYYGDLAEVRIIRDRRSNRSKGFGFVSFEQQEAATAALAMHQQDYDGRALIVRYAKPPA